MTYRRLTGKLDTLEVESLGAHTQRQPAHGLLKTRRITDGNDGFPTLAQAGPSFSQSIHEEVRGTYPE